MRSLIHPSCTLILLGMISSASAMANSDIFHKTKREHDQYCENKRVRCAATCNKLSDACGHCRIDYSQCLGFWDGYDKKPYRR
jgi:hypothetical protein